MRVLRWPHPLVLRWLRLRSSLLAAPMQLVEPEGVAPAPATGGRTKGTAAGICTRENDGLSAYNATLRPHPEFKDMVRYKFEAVD